MSTQTNQRELTDFELQINLEHAFAQLERDDDNASLLKCLKAQIYLAQNQSIENLATKIGKTYNETINYIFYCKQSLMQCPPIRQCCILTHDEQDWIDLLAGKSVQDANPEIVRETQIFRAALLSYSDKPKDADEIPYPHILEQVLARLETEKQPPITKKKSWFKKLCSQFTISHAQPMYRPYYALAVLFICVLVGLPLLHHFQPIPSIVQPSSSSAIPKGGPCLGVIISSEPQSQVNLLQQELKIHSGVIATITPIKNIEIKEGWRLKAILPADRTTALKEWLQHNELDELVSRSNDLCVNVISNEL